MVGSKVGVWVGSLSWEGELRWSEGGEEEEEGGGFLAPVRVPQRDMVSLNSVRS